MTLPPWLIGRSQFGQYLGPGPGPGSGPDPDTDLSPGPDLDPCLEPSCINPHLLTKSG